MPVEYVNRRGERYYLLQGTTKTGKPKYYVSRKGGGVPGAQMPDGYELYEHPERGIVSVRKVRTSRVRPLEREALARWTRELAGIEYFLVDVQGDSLVIYTPAVDPTASVALLSRIMGPFADLASEREWIGSHASYGPMFRFTLADEGDRLFTVARWCCRGGREGWHFLAAGRPLEVQAREFLPHLNRESFFELI